MKKVIWPIVWLLTGFVAGLLVVALVYWIFW